MEEITFLRSLMNLNMIPQSYSIIFSLESGKGTFTIRLNAKLSKNMVDMLVQNLLMGVFHQLSENHKAWVA